VEKSLAHAALGLIYSAGAHVSRALTHYLACEKVLGPHPKLALGLARLLMDSPDPAQAGPFLEAALTDDATRTPARFYRAQLFAHLNRYSDAIDDLVAVTSAPPARLRRGPFWLRHTSWLESGLRPRRCEHPPEIRKNN